MKNENEKVKPEIIPIKNDKIFHDLINDEDMDMIEWIVMQILGMSYEEIHGNVNVLNIRLTRKRKKERNKYVDLKIDVNDEIIIIELNCNYCICQVKIGPNFNLKMVQFFNCYF